jgi:hypothetical protein
MRFHACNHSVTTNARTGDPDVRLPLTNNKTARGFGNMYHFCITFIEQQFCLFLFQHHVTIIFLLLVVTKTYKSFEKSSQVRTQCVVYQVYLSFGINSFALRCGFPVVNIDT